MTDDAGKRKLSRRQLILLWALIHILFLISFRSKVLVFIERVWLCFTGGRGVRLITGQARVSERQGKGKTHDGALEREMDQ